MSKYPFDDLAAAMRLSPAQAARHLRISGRTEVEYRAEGMSERVADRLAVKAGLHPAVVWPSWHVDALEADAERKRLRDRRNSAKWRARNPERVRSYQESYRASARDALRQYRRRYYAANRDRELARQRAYDEARRIDARGAA